MKFEGERILDLQRQAGVGVDCLDQAAVHQFHTGNGNAELDYLNCSGYRLFHAFERAERSRDRLGNTVETQCDLSNDAKRALRADEEPGQVVTCGGLTRPSTGADDLAIRQYDG
ncbi:hypothetical protein D3C80_551510 [compost metagenome]